MQVEARVADGIAVAGNAALPILVERYRDEGIEAIMAVKHAGGTAAEARAAVAEVQGRWAPVWTAWDALAAAQDGWATALEQAVAVLKATELGMATAHVECIADVVDVEGRACFVDDQGNQVMWMSWKAAHRLLTVTLAEPGTMGVHGESTPERSTSKKRRKRS